MSRHRIEDSDLPAWDTPGVPVNPGYQSSAAVRELREFLSYAPEGDDDTYDITPEGKEALEAHNGRR